MNQNGSFICKRAAEHLVQKYFNNDSITFKGCGLGLIYFIVKTSQIFINGLGTFRNICNCKYPCHSKTGNSNIHIMSVAVVEKKYLKKK